jgi:hypothetical protein
MGGAVGWQSAVADLLLAANPSFSLPPTQPQAPPTTEMIQTMYKAGQDDGLAWAQSVGWPAAMNRTA